MERINFDSITPLRFKGNPFELLKRKMLALNPGANINWDDFIMTITPPASVADQGTVVLSLKHQVRGQYLNPHRTVTFKYTADTSIADIMRDTYKIPEVMHYDDIRSLYNDFDVNFRLFPSGALSADISNAYKHPTEDGKYVTRDESYGFDEVLEEDVNAQLLTVSPINNGSYTITAGEDTNNFAAMVRLLPLTRVRYSSLLFVGKRENTAAKDFNIDGGEFTIGNLGVTLSEITEG